MKKKIIIAAGSIFLLILILFGTYKLMNARSFQLFGGLTDRVETEEKVVALTFDDGPTDLVDEILPLLDQYGVKATFFLIGQEIEQHPDAAEKIAAAGHQIGNHTYSHKRMVFKSPSFIKEEIEKTNTLIKEIGYEEEIDFRPPTGKKLIGLPYYLKKMGQETIMWDVEPDTYYSQPKEKIQYVKETVESGSIILMHPMYDQSGGELEAIKGILSALTEEGYTFVTVEELQKLKRK
jgi:peptidoglycan-N-acetylglucosamine deacetylase